VEDADGRLFVSGRFVPTIEQKVKEVDKYDRHIMGYYRQKGTWNNTVVPSGIGAFNISKEMTTEGLISTLAKLYEKPSASNKVFLMKCLFNMKILEGGSIVDHLNEFNTVTNQLSSVGVTFDDEVRALLFLRSFPESWNGLVMAISNSVFGSNALKFDDVVGAILSEEMRQKSSGETSGNALTT